MKIVQKIQTETADLAEVEPDRLFLVETTYDWFANKVCAAVVKRLYTETEGIDFIMYFGNTNVIEYDILKSAVKAGFKFVRYLDDNETVILTNESKT